VRRARTAFLTLGVMGVGAVASSCGRRATDADCELIVDKSVELQMKEMSQYDKATIAQREQRVRAALDDELRSCQSRRVTARTMACVRTASTMKELDTCLR
jgi:transposase